MAGKRQRQKEKAERETALLSPDSLPIVYTDLRSRAVETKPLAEFLAWAKEEKVLIFTPAYQDFLMGNRSRTAGTVKLLCPSIKTDCTSLNGIAEAAAAFYADRNALFVDDMYKATYQKAVLLIIKREKALRTENKLLEQEDSKAACSESNKTVEVAADCESNKLVEVPSECQDAYNEGQKIVEGSAESQADDTQDAYSEGSQPVECQVAAQCQTDALDAYSERDTVAEDVAKCQTSAQDADSEGNSKDEGTAECQTDASECMLNEEVDVVICQQDAKSNDEAKAKVVKGVNVQKCISNEKGSAKKVVDGDSSKKDEQEGSSCEGWILQLEKGTYDEILIQLLKSSEATTGALEAINSSLNKLHVEMKSLHKAISDNGESYVRVSLALFLQEKWGRCARKISVPIFGRRLPFVYFQPLEDLAQLCLTSEGKRRSVPTDVEIDIFVKVVEKEVEDVMYTPPRVPYRVSDELTTEYGFTRFIIGENTQSRSVCKDAYKHPVKADYSGCTKLLYKFIQVERAFIAAREYYYVGEGYMEAGLIISPSFKNMSNSHELIDQVLAGRMQVFQNIAHLHAKDQMWLTSM